MRGSTMAHTQFDSRNRTITAGDVAALIPVLLLIVWVVARSVV
jgi:hypothetical protein